MESKGSESAAIQILTRAVQLDGENKFSEAVTCYEQGIRLLLLAMREAPSDEKKKHFKKKIEEYLARAEVMKEVSRKQKEERTHKQTHISNNETGYSYDVVFSPLIDEFLTNVEVEDAYIRSTHQIYNFLHFCELLVKKASKLRVIILHTTYCNENAALQKDRLHEMASSLSTYNIELRVQFSDTLHDREIRFNNGWIIKRGRGLDYFKRSSGKFSVGYSDYDLRPCHETTIDIFHQNSVKKL